VNASLVELTRGLWQHGFLIADDLDTLIDSGVISIFMPHGVGHPVGLEVHDPVPEIHSTANVTLRGLRNEYPLKLKFDYEIQKGNVHTVEPGVYFIPYLLAKAKNATLGVSHLINWEKVEEWKDVGGVRIEDVVAIDLQGKSVVLSKL
jgi:Xaa-Pro dipeptidase